MRSRAHALALATKKQWTLFLNLANLQRRLPLVALGGKDDEWKDLVTESLLEIRALPYISTAVQLAITKIIFMVNRGEKD